MGADAAIREWQKRAGIQPPSGREAALLEELSQAAFNLIKIIELHRSGICDGDGAWHGSDVMGGTLNNMARLCSAYMEATGAETDDLPIF
jgi:hypothetical protein